MEPEDRLPPLLPPGGRFPKLRLPWGVLAPVVLLAASVAAIAWLDVSSGGAAKPKPLVGEIGTPVRSVYLAPTATPIGAKPKPKASPTSAIGGSLPKGTPADRDAKRRSDLLLLLDAAQQYKAKNGAYPDTHNHVQTLCVYKDLDAGCKLKQTFAGTLPDDPRGNQNGYWIQSDGQAIKLYASFELPLNDAAQCPTTDVELMKHSNLACVSAS